MKLTLTVDVDPDIDPARTDPHDIATAILESYIEDRRHAATPEPAVEFVSAEWDER